ncbi:hypothetical protein V144x_13010 [Gimesia aquarii]|uniref:Uncharacterized protein n=1 Tax=Gimesia aquarii TaxID=2527964 RepID=A0A517VS73_9PLAN|nr:hypothetical protein V144x_13010 [Gimesia aquarii]
MPGWWVAPVYALFFEGCDAFVSSDFVSLCLYDIHCSDGSLSCGKAWEDQEKLMRLNVSEVVRNDGLVSLVGVENVFKRGGSLRDIGNQLWYFR